MPTLTAALLKSQIEAQLAHRIPAALSPMAREEAERQPLHDPQLTELLGGGVPLGGITEIHGEASSGRTSMRQIWRSYPKCRLLAVLRRRARCCRTWRRSGEAIGAHGRHG